MYISQLMSFFRLSRSLLLGGALLALGCDPIQPAGRDASAPAPRTSQVSVRIDAPGGGTPSVSVLAFRASVTGPRSGADVLDVIDPLVAAAPSRCELFDVGKAARALRAQGGTIDLEELASVSLALGHDSETVLRPAPRVYPQLDKAVGGVISEAGPFDLGALPESLELGLPGDEARLPLAFPEFPRLIDQNGELLAAGTRLDPARDLQLTVAGPAHSFLEIRPFGASRFIACPAGPGGRVVVPRDLLEKLTATSGHVAVSFEAVWRDSRVVGGQATRLSIEARSSAVLDLRAQPAQVIEAAKSAAPMTP
jgi:hypothetical protein